MQDFIAGEGEAVVQVQAAADAEGSYSGKQDVYPEKTDSHERYCGRKGGFVFRCKWW